MALSDLRLIACAAALYCFSAIDFFAQPCQVALILSVTYSDDDNLNNEIDSNETSCIDTDADGICDIDDPDDDNDGVLDLDDPDPLDPSSCGDTDGDMCDDCSIGTDGFGPLDDFDPANDGTDTDGDGLCDLGDPDDDNDGVLDPDDPDPLDPSSCGDTDGDMCDDCSVGTDGFGLLDDFDPSNDGTDTDGDGLCDLGDPDDDNDGVTDYDDPNPLDPNSCGDADNDSCDDCAVGTDDFGPMPDFDTSNDGPDMDLDGICDLSDNCPDHINPLQSDVNNNGIGDVCDTTFITMDNVGIGTDTPRTRLHVGGGILFIDNTSGGFLMRAPDGSCWFVSISNEGVLSSVVVDCPE